MKLYELLIGQTIELGDGDIHDIGNITGVRMDFQNPEKSVVEITYGHGKKDEISVGYALSGRIVPESEMYFLRLGKCLMVDMQNPDSQRKSAVITEHPSPPDLEEFYR